MADFKHGDRVRVTFEGTWDYDPTSVWGASAGVNVGGGYKLYERHTLDRARAIERIEPPVEVFKPGDRLRPTSNGIPCEITLGSDGYLQHFIGRPGGVWFYEYVANERESFNSTRYEKVYPSDG